MIAMYTSEITTITMYTKHYYSKKKLQITLNKTSKIILTGFMIALLSTGFPTFMIQDAYAVASVSSVVTNSSTQITITFSEAVRTEGVTVSNAASDWTVGGVAPTSVTNLASTTSTTVVLTMSSANAIETDALPTVVYTDPGDDTVIESASDSVDITVNQAATDGAPPTVSSAQTTSSTTIDVTFSEDIVDTASDLDDYTINGVAGGSDISAISVSGAILTLTTNGYSILYGETVTVSFDGEANELEDTGTLNDVADFTNQSVTNNVSYVANSDCYDCIPPTLQESHITILNNHYVVATGDEPISITASVGDEISIVLKITDNISVQSIPSAALYTNFEQKPSDMNLFYTNNFDNLKQTSTSFYEWNVHSDDVAYDYDGTISWSDNAPTVVTDVITEDNFKFKNQDQNTLEYFMMPFTFTINDHMDSTHNHMDSTQITAKIYDAAGNRLHVTLPVTLKTAGNEPLDFDNMGNQKVLGFYDKSVLSEIISQWSESESDTKQLSSLLGISEEQLPPWTSNLAKWVAEDKIDSAEMIVAVEYLINL